MDFKQALKDISDGKVIDAIFAPEALTVGHVLDVDRHVSDADLPKRNSYVYVLKLLGLDKDDVDEGNFLKKVKTATTKIQKIRKKPGKDAQEKEELDKVFEVSIKGRPRGGAAAEVNACNRCVMKEERLKTAGHELKVWKERNKGIQEEVERLKKREIVLMWEVEKLEKNVKSLDPLNVERRKKRRDEKIISLDEQIEKLKNQVDEKKKEQTLEQERWENKKEELATELKLCKDELEFERVKANAMYEKAAQEMEELKESVESMRKSVWYYRKKGKGESKSDVNDLKERVRELENENSVLNERIEEFLECEEIKCFEGGKYKTEVRRVYQNLLSDGVSASKCEQIVKGVLNGFGVRVDRLPKASTAKEISLECRALACMQLCELLKDGENVTLMSDGTTKFGYGYETLNVSMSDGRVYAFGLRDVPTGSSEWLFHVMKDIIQDMFELNGDENASEKVKEFIVKVRNTMSDRAANEKKFNALLDDVRKELLPEYVEGWNEKSEEERKQWEKMNNFYCGMHAIVGLAEETDVTMRVWETLVFGDADVGADAAIGKAWKCESGTVRMIRTVCKAVQDKGCEKSGKGVHFRAYAEHEFGILKIPLSPFEGNRFNILFHNGAGVYFLIGEIRSFLEMVKDENKLMKAVHADVNVDQFVAGARAFGLIDKMVTTPLWKVLERKEHISGVKPRFEKMIECLNGWAEDASGLLSGRDRMYDDVDVEEDKVYERLIQPCALDGMTKQVLELLCAAYAVKLRRMMHDELNEEDMDESVTKSAPRTNVACERDFGMLDYMMRVKPSAHTCVHEGLIMFKKNDTKEWLTSLTEDRLTQVCEKARKSVEEQKRLYVRRKAVIGAERASRLISKRHESEQRKTNEMVRAEKLTSELDECGGLWRSAGQMDDWLEGKEDDQRRLGLESQLRFRKFVLKCKNGSGILNITKDGKAQDLMVLVGNMRRSFTGSAEDQSVENVPQDFRGRIAAQGEVDAIKEDHLAQEPKSKKAKLEVRKVPILTGMNDLVGKRVEHLGERNVRKKGVVLDMVERTVSKCVCKIRFDGEEECDMEVKEHMRTGHLRVVELCVQDLLDKRVRQRFKDEDTEEQSWWNARVVKVKNVRHGRPEFQLEYEEDEDEDDDEGAYWFKLYEDYANGDLQLL